jgi:prevent-host-death family protein
MTISLIEDIRPVTDLKRDALSIVRQVRRTGRPVVLTAEGKADVVVMDARMYEEHLKAMNLSRLLVEGEADIAAGRVRPMRSFLREFKRGKKISR